MTPAPPARLLEVEDNHLTGSWTQLGGVPLSAFSQLRFLSAGGNPQSGTLAAFAALPALEALLVSDAGITGPLPPQLLSRPGLRYLDLDDNALT